ncbi:MAG: hypothetical protein KGN16_17680 [Burkholderiales bacterium]|nr:hypothetical protein [Burkholderiales bacterium]
MTRTAGDIPAHPAVAPGEGQAATPDPLAWTRPFLGGALMGADQWVDWLTQNQKAQLRSSEACALALAEALRGTEAAAGFPQMMNSLLEFAGRQWLQGIDQMTTGAAEWVGAQVRFADRVRAEAFDFGQASRTRAD